MHSQTAVLSKKVREAMGPSPRSVPRVLDAREALALLTEQRAPRLVVVDADGRPVGLVTASDVLRRGAWRVPAGQPVTAVMTAPVVTVAEGDELFRAFAIMRRRQLSRVPVVGAEGRLCGMLELGQALWALAGPVMPLLDRLARADSAEALRAVMGAQTELAAQLLDDNVPGPEIQAALSEINAELHRRALALAIAGMETDGWGPPPVAFSLILMGSHGRRENFLAPDQDNAFVLADYEDAVHDRVNAYFVPLAERFVALLDSIGFASCKGNVMAVNPVWRKRLSEWVAQVTGWVERRADQHLLLSDVLIDFRHAAGEEALSDRLREAMRAAIARRPRFVRDLFTIEADHGVALGWFGGLSKERDAFDRPGFINMKLRGTLPLVEAARLMSLRAGVTEIGTLARLHALRDRKLLAANEHDDLVAGYALMSRLVLREQVASARAGGEINDYVSAKTLSKREEEQLVACFRNIQALRAGLRMQLTEGGV